MTTDGKIKLVLFRIPLYVSTLSHMFSVTVTQGGLLLALPYVVLCAVRKKLWRYIPLLVPIGMWVSWIIFGSFFIPDQSRILKQMLSWWRMLFFFFGYLAVKMGENPRRLSLFVVASSVTVSLYGVFQFFVTGSERAVGTFSNSLTYSNNLALVAMGITSWILFSRESPQKERLYLLFALGVILAGIFVGLSRMVIYGIILLGAVLLIIRYRMRALVAVSLAILVFVFATFNHPRFQRLYNRGEGVVVSDSTRAVLWKSALSMIKDYPLFGIGVHVFPKLIDSYDGGYSLDAKGHAHNAYLQAALDYGIPGLVLLINIFFSLAVFLARFFKKTGSVWAAAGLSVLAIYLLEGLTENNFGDAEVSMCFWFIQGLITGALKVHNDESLSG